FDMQLFPRISKKGLDAKKDHFFSALDLSRASFFMWCRRVYNFVYFRHRVCGGYNEKYFFQTYL
ncbi:hypothetical protein, partial [Bacteroides hominis]|uniref:hypothetical protein n=1 Tax=Bacteroides hominis TaxID=2763023 RepID=UPI001D0E1D07